MAIQSVNHIADVSFKDHFFAGPEANAPTNGKITVNHNTFTVRFENGRVNAKFTTGNAFTNLFRSSTLSRFTQQLQTQYDAWLDEQRKIADEQRRIEQERQAELEQTLGFDDNPDAGKIPAVIEEFKAILEEMNPPGKDVFVARLNEIASLAALRNTLTRVSSGTECNEILKKANHLTHFDDNAKKLDPKGKKGYVLNMLDALIGGILSVASQMKDKKTEVVDFLRDFDGACVEAKNDNIQDWLSRVAGISNVARSDPSHDLAFSVTLEFAALAEEVRAPYYEDARKSCEAEVRAACAKKNITNEAEIQKKIEAKVAMIVLDQDDEIQPKIRKKLEEFGKFAVYEALVGAKRPITQIEKGENGKWIVTTLVNEAGAPILKPVSAFDIDKNFSKLVDMYMEDAFGMGMVERRTSVGNPVFAVREDNRADAVLDEAAKYVSGQADVAELSRLVKAEFSYETDLKDEDFQAQVKVALDEIAAMKKDDPKATKKAFWQFMDHYADASYYDRMSDLERLVHLVTRRTELLVDRKKMYLSKIDDASFRCAKMMQNLYRKNNIRVYPAKAQLYIKETLKLLVNRAFSGQPGNKTAVFAQQALNNVMLNGTLISDHPAYDLGHRPGGHQETELHKILNVLKLLMMRLGNAQERFYQEELKG